MNYAFVVCFVFTFFFTIQTQTHPSITGSIIFGSHVFPISLYQEGKKVPTEVNIQKKQLTFTVHQNSDNSYFYLFTGPKINYTPINPKEPNTVDYLKIPSDQPYVLYEIAYSADKKWIVQERFLDSSRRIPDAALIICCLPEFLMPIESNSTTELPTIRIRPDIESIQDWQQKVNTLTLASIDMDAFHSRKKQPTIKITQNTVIVAPLS